MVLDNGGEMRVSNRPGSSIRCLEQPASSLAVTGATAGQQSVQPTGPVGSTSLYLAARILAGGQSPLSTDSEKV